MIGPYGFLALVYLQRITMWGAINLASTVLLSTPTTI
jgi:hypothetical protein